MATAVTARLSTEVSSEIPEPKQSDVQVTQSVRSQRYRRFLAWERLFEEYSLADAPHLMANGMVKLESGMTFDSEGETFDWSEDESGNLIDPRAIAFEQELERLRAS